MMPYGVNNQNQYGGRCYVHESIIIKKKTISNNSSVGIHVKMENDDIKEGFICPMCMKDLGNASVLQKHFEEVHSDDKDTLRQIRGMFGKAKRKIMDKIESSETDGAIGETVDGALEGPVNRGVDPFLWDSQDFGEENWEFVYP